MLRFLPVIIIIVLILGGLGYWRFVASKSNLNNPVGTQTEAPIEVPKTLPQAGLEDRVKALEDLASKLVSAVNSLKGSTSQSKSSSSDTKLNDLDASITELKARISALEKATPAPVTTTTGKSTVYIPLGSGGQINSGTDWVSLSTFQATVDPSSYPEYKSMQLEVNMRLNQPGGTLYARLNSNGSIDSSQVSSTSTSSTLVTSGNFTVSGSKTYTLQAKSSDGTQVFIDTARIKVNF